jgi:hypothetical protein
MVTMSSSLAAGPRSRRPIAFPMLRPRSTKPGLTAVILPKRTTRTSTWPRGSCPKRCAALLFHLRLLPHLRRSRRRSPDKSAALALLDLWGRELDACYEGRARHPVFVALAETIRACSIPKEPFADLLVAFRQDQTVTRYATMDDVLGYCRYSANPVGRLVLYACGEVSPEKIEENFRLSDAPAPPCNSPTSGRTCASISCQGPRLHSAGRHAPLRRQ